MKLSTIILPVLLFLLLSCSTKVVVIEKELNTLVFDFTKYSKKGFMFTPEKYDGKYESIGIIDMVIYSKMTQAQKAIDGKPVVPGTWVYEPLNTSEIIELAYQKAVNMGANAVTNFKISESSKYHEKFQIEIPGIRLTGFAIKILK
jgi:hypothetical protein